MRASKYIAQKIDSKLTRRTIEIYPSKGSIRRGVTKRLIFNREALMCTQ